MFYIGQTINVGNRSHQHSGKLKGDKNERFNNFKEGKLFIFYGPTISQNLNYIEKTLIKYFIRDFNFLNYVNPQKVKEGKRTYLSRILANKDMGNESYKSSELRTEIDQKIIKEIIKILIKENVIKSKYSSKVSESALFSETPFFELSEKQKSILNQLVNSKIINENERTCNISLIKGSPGTGKTILLLHLIATLKNEYKDLKIGVFLRTTQRSRFKKILKDYGLDPKKNNIIINTFNKMINSKYDYIIVDEAQRTTRRVENGIYPCGAKPEYDKLVELDEKSVIDVFIKKTNNLVLAYDDNQVLRFTDNLGLDDNINKKGKVILQEELPYQLRILKGSEKKFADLYIKIIKYILKLNFDDEVVRDDKFEECCKKFKEYNKKFKYIKIEEDFELWKKYIEEKQEYFYNKKSVFLSGFCKKISSDKKFKGGLYWCKYEDAENWRKYENKSRNVGCVFDILGFDIDFAGVYIGEDIYYCPKKKEVCVNKEKFYNSQTKKGVDNIDRFVLNSYYVLLTRAIYGNCLYIEDEELRNFVKEKLV